MEHASGLPLAWQPYRCPWCLDVTDSPYATNGVARCVSCDRTFTPHQEARYLLLTLWSKARGHEESYVKAEWRQLQALVGLLS